MKTRLITAIVCSSVVFAIGAHAQTTDVAAASPAPSVSANVAPTATPSTALTPNQIVYAPRLPSATDLTTAAAAQGLTVDKIEQTSNQITAVYRYANGQTNVVAYLVLPPAGATARVVATPATPPPTVVYDTAPQTVYYDDYGPAYYPYYPYYWYPPVSVRLGLGFGYRYGGFRGGFHGGHWH